jgi:hypothetical protein
MNHRLTRWILQRLAVDRMSVSPTAKALGVGWQLVNNVAVTAARNLVYGDHLAGVRILGVDEHVWKHTRRLDEPSSMVTVLVDLTPLIDGTGPARLIDIQPGRSADVLKGWLNDREHVFRDTVEVVTSGTGSPATPPPWTSPHPRRGRSWTLPRHPPGRRETHRMSATTTVRNDRPAWAEERSAVQAPTGLSDQDRFHHRPAEITPGTVVGHR